MTANPNSKWNKLKERLITRWSQADFPGSKPRIQAGLILTDISKYLVLPVVLTITYNSCVKACAPVRSARVQVQVSRDSIVALSSKSQIIDFKRLGTLTGTFGQFAPGTVVKVRLQNSVETFQTAPVHAQVIDNGIGRELLGGVLLGDAVPDSTFERINITFRYVRDPRRQGVAVGLQARAMDLDGSLGLPAEQKEAFFTRSILTSAQGASGSRGDSGTGDFKETLFRALASGLIHEFGDASKVENSRAHVLVLRPGTEFLVELTDFFPGRAPGRSPGGTQ